MPVLPGPSLRPRIPDAPDLVRDGLERFGAALFVDPALALAGAADLLASADFLRYQSSHPRPLVGMHAVLGIDEITLVALPDAIQRGWVEAKPESVPVPPPSAPFPQAAPGRFLACSVPTLPAILLQATEADPQGTFTLTWTGPDAPGASYVVEESTDPTGWDTALPVYSGTGRLLQIYGRAAGVYFYRARALVGSSTTDWSEGISVPVGPAGRWIQTDVAGAGDPAAADGSVAPFSSQSLLAIHRALLRTCRARGDLFAVLSLPAHYHEDQAAAHVASVKGSALLLAGPDTPGALPLAGEERAFSFGAVYHPWTLATASDQPDNLHLIPPDGVACGVLARRASSRGAWVAAANEPIIGVVQLRPAIAPSAHQMLQDAGVNLIRQEARGFLTLSADTLADGDLQPIGVRRLLSLLQRVALLHGPTYVFEPDDEGLQRRSRRAFEAVLNRLFSLGAFAGTGPDDAYRVNVYAAGSTSGLGSDQLVVELKVAPSLPMRFLTVRLVNSGDQGLRVEGP